VIGWLIVATDGPPTGAGAAGAGPGCAVWATASNGFAKVLGGAA